MLGSYPFRAFIEEVGDLARFTGRFFRELFRPNMEWEELLRQAFINGYRSLPLVAVTAFIMGLVLTVQSRPTLERFGAESMLPAMVAISVVREIAPVITALICACLLYTSDAADERSSVDLGGRRIIKKQKNIPLVSGWL